MTMLRFFMCMVLMVPPIIQGPGGKAGIGGKAGVGGGGSTAANNISVVEYICVNNTGVSGCQANGTSSATATFGTSTTSGELIFAITTGGITGTAYGSVTDSGSQSYTQDATLRKTGIGSHFASTVWFICGSASGISSFTWTYGSGDGNGSSLIVAHVKGIATSSCKDTSVNYPASASNTPFTSSSITPATGHNEWIVGVVATGFSDSPTLTATSPYTLKSSTVGGNPIALMDQFVISTSGTYAGAGTGSFSGAIYFPATISFTH